MDDFPKIGVGVFVKHNGKILLQKRIGAHGEGTWSLPGGHLEFYESIEGCAEREVMEEIGVSVKNVKIIGFTNDIMEKDGKHYITIFVESELANGEPRIMEPDRTSEVAWVTPPNWLSPLFLPLKNFLDGKKYP